MGRYYSGDIKGKFWFGVQPSDDASFFGGQEIEPSYIEYYFNKEDLEDINNGIKACRDILGNYEQEFNDYFKKNNGYTDEDMQKTFDLTKLQFNELITFYARLKLGLKILDCVEKNEDCTFQAEI